MLRRFMRHSCVLVVATAIVALGDLNGQEVIEGDSSRVVETSLAWLSILDQGLADVALDSAAPLLRSIVGSPENWEQMIQLARRDFVAPVDREVIAFEAQARPPGVPPGEYSSVTFRVASLERIMETVVLVLTPTGWRVAMYGVRMPQ